MTRPRIVVASWGDPASDGTWSGTPRHMIDAFAAGGAEVIPLGVTTAWRRPLNALGRLRSAISRDTHVYARHPWFLDHLSSRFAAALRRLGPVDLVVTLGSFPILVPGGIAPVVNWIDATVDGLIDFNDEWTGWSASTVGQFRAAEQRALARAGLVVVASEWARRQARAVEGVTEDRVVVIPFGANLPQEPAGVDPRLTSPLRLLAVGNRWHHKGMDIAVATAELLNAGGVPTRLDIVGCQPPPGTVLPASVTCHGYVSKATPDGWRRLDELYRSAAVFVLPSLTECFGVVFCEAAAYGLPVIAPRIGGIPTAVQDGVTGLLVTGGPESYAAAVRQIVETPGTYRQMSAASRDRYLRELNWGRATGRLLELVRAQGGGRTGSVPDRT